MLMACLALLAASPAWALDKVSLQLKWKHQFQFAGYYAALEKGFYRDAGLDVEIREGGPDVDAAKAVAAGQADFGVCTSSVLLDRAAGRNLVVLGVIFQHSAAIILVPRRAGIATVSELKGRRLMDTPGSDDIAAMLKREGVDYASLPRVPHNGDPRDLLERQGGCHGRVQHERAFCPRSARRAIPDLLAARVRNRLLWRQPLYLRAAGQGASRARAGLSAASLKGWQYALSHKEEIVDLILRRYSQQKSRDALLFEAIRTEALVQPDLISSAIRTRSTGRTSPTPIAISAC